MLDELKAIANGLSVLKVSPEQVKPATCASAHLVEVFVKEDARARRPTSHSKVVECWRKHLKQKRIVAQLGRSQEKLRETLLQTDPHRKRNIERHEALIGPPPLLEDDYGTNRMKECAACGQGRGR